MKIIKTIQIKTTKNILFHENFEKKKIVYICGKESSMDHIEEIVRNNLVLQKMNNVNKRRNDNNILNHKEKISMTLTILLTLDEMKIGTHPEIYKKMLITRLSIILYFI